MRMLEPGKLVIATHNKGKLDEFRALLEPHGYEVKSAADFGLTEPAETENTFIGNARIKAHYAAKTTGLPALADDSGLCVDCLDGAPGVYTADWAETPHGRDWTMAMTKVQKAMDDRGAPAPRTGRFCSTMVLAWPDGEDMIFEGHVDGQLVWPVRGALGHGYDPMFQPDGETITFAEMDPERKNQISHRAVAFNKFAAAILGAKG